MRKPIGVRRYRRAALAIGVLIAGGCADAEMIAPSALAPAAPSLATPPRPVVTPGKVEICKDGPDGTSTFTVELIGPGTLPLGNTFSLAAGSCATVWLGTSGETSNVRVSEATLPPGTNFERIRIIEGSYGTVDNTARRVSFRVNKDHGAAAVFFNVAVLREKVTICKSGPPGSYGFSISAGGGNLLLGSTFNIEAGSCAAVWEGTSTDAVSVTVTEILVADGARFDHIEVNNGIATVDNPNRSVTFTASSDHGGSATFYNVPDRREKITICKQGPAGSYGFTLSSTGGNALLGNSFSVAAGECREVWEGTSKAATEVTITEVNLPAGTLFDRVEVNSGLGTANNSQKSVHFFASSDHGGSATFYNIAAQPALRMVKLTNGTDNNTPTGPVVEAGATVTWTYNVTNTGNVSLSGITVTDNKLPSTAIDCGNGTNVIATLAPGASASCTASGKAVPGQYSNVGTATSSYEGTPVSASDIDHYFGKIDACTPGFWQGGRGAELWQVASDSDWKGRLAQPFNHATSFNSVFTSHSAMKSETMLSTIMNGGTEVAANKAGRSLVAGYLNTSYKTGYPWSQQQLKDKWTAAVKSGDAALLALHEELDRANNDFDCR